MALSVDKIANLATIETCLDSQPQALSHYVIVRSDLPRGLQVAVVVHAAGESSNRVPPGTNAVALAAADEVHLESIRALLEEHDIPHAAIVESDAPYAGQLCAIGIEPVRDRKRVRRVVSSLPLVR